MDNTYIVCVGYVQWWRTGFIFVADKANPVVWRLDSYGNLLTENFVKVEGLGQLAKIRKDSSSGFIACSTAWGALEGSDVNVVALVKFSDGLSTEWSEVNRKQNYVLGKTCTDLKVLKPHVPYVMLNLILLYSTSIVNCRNMA